MKSIQDFNVAGKRILVRCDFNIALNEKGEIDDDFKIQKTIPTIQYLIAHNAKVVLLSHLGKPDGKRVETLTLDRVKDRLEKLLQKTIEKTDDCIGSKVEEKALNLKDGEVLLLENVRFYLEEEKNDEEFGRALAGLADIYINDAFAECHRSYASIVQVPRFLPHGAGLLLQKEVENLNKILENPARPFVVLMGGAKIETKVKFIESISEIADALLIGGLMKKEIQENQLKIKHPEKIIGPEDNLEALDIDKKTIEVFTNKILKAKTIFWNGPFGKFEEKQYTKGTKEIAKAIIKSKAFSVVGGGETIEFLNKEKMLSKFNHISTGGGALLDYLSGEAMPGIEALQ